MDYRELFMLLWKGLMGMAASFGSLAFSMHTTIEALQAVSLSVGIVVGLLTIVSLVRKLRRH